MRLPRLSSLAAALLLAAPAAAQEANPLNLWVLDLRETPDGAITLDSLQCGF